MTHMAIEKGKRYVLVVDPDVDERFRTCMLLLQFGRNIFTANSAEEAIEFMNRRGPAAAVVADGGIIGTTLLSLMKNDPRFSIVPVIFLSAMPDDKKQQGEAAACIRKPVNVHEFYRVVQTVIEQGPRENIRIATSLSATVEDGLPGSEGFITVLSEYGLFFRTLQPRPVKACVPVRFQINGRPMKLDSLVLYHTSFNDGPSKQPGMGMKFVDVGSEDRESIKKFILEQINQGMAG